ncbi:MAG TPA: DEAD/DEAH box helicase [Kofleriaceae bacterium]|nr:DEAD/DEAH box helicase [Kofleriaceae bacterium]
MKSFDELGLAEPLLRAIREEGYQTPTPIQTQAIPPVLSGRDLIGCAQTGTGKTAAFALPLLQTLAGQPRARAPRALVVSPTRELAAQIGADCRAYGRHLPLSGTVIFGGVSQEKQVAALRRGIDVLVATPGRLLDLLEQGHVRLDAVSILVLDEADRMLDMGFLPDVRRIIRSVPAKRQTLLFSATMPREIAELAERFMIDPIRVAVAPPASAAETVRQRVYLVGRDDKPQLLAHLLADPAMARVLVFTRTKHGADRLCKRLERDRIRASAIHGNKSQNQRTRALDEFRRGQVRVLCASDIAARGLDIDDVTHVVNFDVPNEPETYVHRIGRTGRAGASGEALSLCGPDERAFLRDIEAVLGRRIEVVADHPYPARAGREPAPEARSPQRRPQQPRGQRRPQKGRGPARAAGASTGYQARLEALGLARR